MPASLQDCILQPSHTKGVIKSAMRSAEGCDRIWCVVESDDDAAAYEKFFVTDGLSVLPSTDESGKRSCRNVEEIVSQLYAEEDNPKLFGIRDRDYTPFSPGYRCPDNVFMTDDRDLEMMMLKSPSVAAGLATRHQDFPAKMDESAAIMRFLGYLRIYNDVAQTSCTFKGNLTKVSLVWDERSHSIYPDYKDRLFSKFQDVCEASVVREDFDNFVSDNNLEEKPIFEVCRGHDVCRLLCSMMVKKEFSQTRVISNWMREAYSPEDFVATSLYNDMLKWSMDRELIIFNWN